MDKINSSEGELTGREFMISRQFNVSQKLVVKLSQYSTNSANIYLKERNKKNAR